MRKEFKGNCQIFRYGSAGDLSWENNRPLFRQAAYPNITRAGKDSLEEQYP